MIAVFLADDHPVVAQGVASFFDAQPDLHIVGEARDGEGLLTACRASGADVLVLDLQMPGRHGLELVQELAREGLTIVVFSVYAEGPMAAEAIAAGARWVVPKQSGLSTLADAVRSVHRGEVLAVARPEAALATLSRRELQVFREIVTGHPLKVIAADLQLSAGTVHTYAHRIRKKLGVATIPDLVSYAHRLGLHLGTREH